MKNSWAPSNLDGPGEIFETLHSGLKVKLIATPREDLSTCRPDENVSAVLRRNIELYDFIPVVNDTTEGNQHIIGLFHAANYKSNNGVVDRIQDRFARRDGSAGEGRHDDDRRHPRDGFCPPGCPPRRIHGQGRDRRGRTDARLLRPAAQRARADVPVEDFDALSV
jgi:hypothetical protein